MATKWQGALTSLLALPVSLQTLCVLKGFHRRAVSLLRFSKNGKLLATVGHDTHHR